MPFRGRPRRSPPDRADRDGRASAAPRPLRPRRSPPPLALRRLPCERRFEPPGGRRPPARHRHLPALPRRRPGVGSRRGEGDARGHDGMRRLPRIPPAGRGARPPACRGRSGRGEELAMNSGSESDRARSPRLRRVLWALLALVVTAAAISWLSPPPALGIPPPREPHEPVDPTNPPDPHDPSDPSDPTGHEPPPIFAPAAVCPDGALPLAASEARDLALRAATAIDPSPMTVAVVDRAGNVLALLRRPSGGTALDDRAIGLARTGAFFSSDQAPLSSRTVRFISGLHFPPGIRRTPNAALYGIENTNRGCDLNVAFLPGKAVPPARRFAGGACQS